MESCQSKSCIKATQPDGLFCSDISSPDILSYQMNSSFLLEALAEGLWTTYWSFSLSSAISDRLTHRHTNITHWQTAHLNWWFDRHTPITVPECNMKLVLHCFLCCLEWMGVNDTHPSTYSDAKHYREKKNRHHGKTGQWWSPVSAPCPCPSLSGLQSSAGQRVELWF